MSRLNKNQVKTVVAASLVIVGILMLLLWEGWGREHLLYQKVMVAEKDMKAGTKITDSMLIEKSFAADTLIKGAVKVKHKERLVGQKVKQYIPANAQISSKFLYKDDFYIGPKESIYKIPATWIDSRSASIRRGDRIKFVTRDGGSAGIFTVAFVKDSEEREVTSTESQWYAEALDRTDSTGVISNIEIIATLEEYNALKSLAESGDVEHPHRFLIVQVFGGDE